MAELMETEAMVLFKPIRIRRSVRDPFFALGDRVCSSVRKQTCLPSIEDDNDASRSPMFHCSWGSCTQSFRSVADYASHERTAHWHTCLACRRVFPSRHLLDIHLAEEHDPLFSILANQRKMYRCLVEACLETFDTPEGRKKHLIAVHQFPANFRFIYKPNSRKVKKEVVEEKGKSNTSQKKSAKTVPTVIRFGQGACRGFIRTRHPKNRRRGFEDHMDITKSEVHEQSTISCHELQSALPSDEMCCSPPLVPEDS